MGRECRALQLADDLAIISESEHDQSLLLMLGIVSATSVMFETQTKKTESMVFCHQNDDTASIVDDSFW